MRILYICDEYPPGKTGGIGIAVQSLARQLSKSGHQVWVAGLYDEMYGGENEFKDGDVTVFRLRYGPRSSFLIRAFRKMPAFARRMAMDIQAFKRFCEFVQDLVRREGIEVIEAPDWLGFPLHSGARIDWPKFTVPFVVKSHGSFTYLKHELGQRSNPRMFYNDRQLMLRADGFCAVSNYTAEQNRRIFNRAADVLPNGIEVLPASSDKRLRDKVVFSGSLSPVKGIQQLMKGWNRVHLELPHARLHIYGKGKQKWLKELLSREAADSVVFHGHVTREQVIHELQSAALAVFPSYSETFGLMAAEAMAAGCPLIYTKRSSGPDLVDNGVTGLLVDPDRPEEISSAIISLLKNSAHAQQMAEAARVRLEQRFSIERVAEQHVEYYNKCIAQFKGE